LDGEEGGEGGDGGRVAGVGGHGGGVGGDGGAQGGFDRGGVGTKEVRGSGKGHVERIAGGIVVEGGAHDCVGLVLEVFADGG